MSQWGEAATISGIEFVPHVETKGFKNIRNTDTIDDLYVIGISKKAKPSDVEKLKQKYIGAVYNKQKFHLLDEEKIKRI